MSIYYKTLVENYLLLLLCFFVLHLSGEIVLRLFGLLNPRIKDIRGGIRFLFALVSGLITMPTVYAFWITSGGTILTVVIPLWYLALSEYRNESYVRIEWKLLSALIIGFSALFGAYTFKQTLNCDLVYRPVHWDIGTYFNIYYGMVESGKESIFAFPNQMNSPETKVPYHYFDVWNAGVWSRISGQAYVVVYTYTLPIMISFVIFFALLIFLITRKAPHFTALSVLALFIFWQQPNWDYIYEYIGYHIRYDPILSLFHLLADYADPNAANSTRPFLTNSFKHMPITLLCSLSLLFSLRNSKYLFLMMPIINISCVALWVICILFCAYFVLKMFLEKFDAKHMLFVIACSFVFAYFILHYSYQFNSNQPISVVNVRMEFSLLEFVAEMAAYFFKNLVVIILLFAVHGLIILLVLRPALSSILQNSFFLFLLLTLSIFIAFIVSYVFNNEDGKSFIYTALLYPTVLILACASFLVSRIKISAILFAAFVYLSFYEITMKRESVLNSFEFLSTILNERVHSKTGAFIFGRSYIVDSHVDLVIHKKKIFLFNTNILILLSPNYVGTICLSDLHVPIDSTNARELAIQRQFLFLNYYLNLKKSEPDISEPEAQIRFMKERGIDWIFVDHTYDWPEEWDVYVRKKIVDPNTRDMMVYLKPWTPTHAPD